MERRPERGEVINNLYERLSDLYNLQEKEWKVDAMVEKVQEQIRTLLEEFRQERLAELRQELESERKRVSSNNS